MQLYLYNVSGGLMKPTNTDTGLGIVVKSTVKPYLAKNRFERHELEAADPDAARLDPALVAASVHSGAPTPTAAPADDPPGQRREAVSRSGVASCASSSTSVS